WRLPDVEPLACPRAFPLCFAAMSRPPQRKDRCPTSSAARERVRGINNSSNDRSSLSPLPAPLRRRLRERVPRPPAILAAIAIRRVRIIVVIALVARRARHQEPRQRETGEEHPAHHQAAVAADDVAGVLKDL